MAWHIVKMTTFGLLKEGNSHTPGVLAKILHTLTTLFKSLCIKKLQITDLRIALLQLSDITYSADPKI